jgi:dTDP-4-amino-4,6-dideoxygalactose transaminase
VAALRSGWVAPAGPEIGVFENEIAARVCRTHAVAVNSGTAALHLVLRAWDIGPGDFVPTASMTFVATANAITYTGATPVFIDCEPATGNIDIALLERAIKTLRAAGKSVPAILPVDFLGKCCDYSALAELAVSHDVRVLLDAAESLGARRKGAPAGSFGEAAIFSFNGNKVLTTSAGGMIVTDDDELAARVASLATQARTQAVHYEHAEVGYNYRMSNVLAALGRAQLHRLDDMLHCRRSHRDAYIQFFSELPGVSVFGRGGDFEDNCWLTAVLVDAQIAGFSRNTLAETLEAADIETRPLWNPMHLQPAYRQHPAYLTGAAENLFGCGLALPSGSAMNADERDRVLAVVESVVDGHR